jgi:hypothetical protein
MEGRVSSIHFLLVDHEEVLIETIAERLVMYLSIALNTIMKSTLQNT